MNQADTITLESFQLINSARAITWHSDKREWLPTDWSNALAGETGELCNLAKKLQRARDGIKSKHFDPAEDDLATFEADIIDAMADEIADVVIYAALNASKLGLNLAHIVQRKFNEDSALLGFSEVL